MVAFLFQMLLGGGPRLLLRQVFAAVDTDGELKKTASESFLSWLDRRLK